MLSVNSTALADPNKKAAKAKIEDFMVSIFHNEIMASAPSELERPMLALVDWLAFCFAGKS